MFCAVCLGDWATHQGSFTCPNAIKDEKKIHVYNGVDYDDENDKSFYPMPLSIDEAFRTELYRRCNFCYNEETLKLSTFKKDECIKNLAEVYKKVTTEKDANELATKIVNDTISAMSILANGQIKLFFCFNNEREFVLFKFYLKDLKTKVDKMISLLNAQKKDANDVTQLNKLINEAADAVLHN